MLLLEPSLCCLAYSCSAHGMALAAGVSHVPKTQWIDVTSTGFCAPWVSVCACAVIRCP